MRKNLLAVLNKTHVKLFLQSLRTTSTTTTQMFWSSRLSRGNYKGCV